MKQLLIGLTTLALNVLPVYAQAELSNKQLIGTWYASNVTEEGRLMQRMVKRMQDKTYVSIELVCFGANLTSVEKEHGSWQLQQNVLVNSPQKIENLKQTKQVKSGITNQFTDIVISEDALSYKDEMQTLLTFKAVSDDFKIGCRAM